MLSFKGAVQGDGSGCSKVHLIGRESGAEVFRKIGAMIAPRYWQRCNEHSAILATAR
jgi:hypothetical protein